MSLREYAYIQNKWKWKCVCVIDRYIYIYKNKSNLDLYDYFSPCKATKYMVVGYLYGFFDWQVC